MDITALKQLAAQTTSRTIRSLFTDEKRADNFSTSSKGLYLDYAKQNITDKELSQLFELAETSNLTEKINAQFSGEIINNTENRAVLHSVLRAPNNIKKEVLGAEADEVIATEQHMANIVDDVSSGALLSASGDKFTDVIAIGIGGSYYGIKVALSALNTFHTTGINAHVIANVDGAAVEEKLAKLTAHTTLV
ncbi:MAG: glucose-6-phosphate isomerase, partial [Colwellia sp.]